MKRFHLPAGIAIDRYQLLRPIGSGGCGTVYEALDPSVGRRVALKACHIPESSAAGSFEARFLREAWAAGQLRHPNVVTLFDAGVEGDLAYLVMELVEGETLGRRVKREGPLGAAATLEVLLPIVSAVAHLHALGIVHRDIKPENILLGTSEPGLGGEPGAIAAGERLSVKLADFGLSRYVEDDGSPLTETGMLVGTLDYLAPEATRGSRHAGEPSDQYSLGVVLYECLTGSKPFCGVTTYDLMEAVLRAEVVPPSAIEPSLPRGLDRVVLRAMSRDPADRFASVADLALALEPFARASQARGRSEEPPASAEVPESAPVVSRSRPAGPAIVHVGDGVAIAIRGDLFVVLWKAPGTLHRIRWAFDLADMHTAATPQGILSLQIILPSSSVPDGQAIDETVWRQRWLQASTRRQSTVAVGGGMWRSVVTSVFRSVFKLPIRPRSGRITISSTVDEAIGLLLEKKGPSTPSRREIWDDVRRLFVALDAPLSEGYPERDIA